MVLLKPFESQKSRFEGIVYFMNRAQLPTRKYRLSDEPDDDYVGQLAPGERMALVWPITLQAWAFQTGTTDEPRLRRDVGRVIRGGR